MKRIVTGALAVAATLTAVVATADAASAAPTCAVSASRGSQPTVNAPLDATGVPVSARRCTVATVTAYLPLRDKTATFTLWDATGTRSTVLAAHKTDGTTGEVTVRLTLPSNAVFRGPDELVVTMQGDPDVYGAYTSIS